MNLATVLHRLLAFVREGPPLPDPEREKVERDLEALERKTEMLRLRKQRDGYKQ